jgi:uncharacterized membrane protein
MPAWFPPRERFVAAWCAFALTLLCAVWFFAISGDATRTRLRAAENDPGRNVVLIVVLAASTMGLVAAIGVLGHDPTDKLHPALIIGLALFAIALSWTLIQTAMTLRYAHLYYHDYDGATGSGILFPGSPEPSDLDFAYFAFVIGMTFQTSDVSITDYRIRRLALLHGLIAFIYNVAIIAVAVNVATGLLH